MLIWSYSEKELSLKEHPYDEFSSVGCGRCLTLFRGTSDSGIHFRSEKESFYVEADDIKTVFFTEPKLFKKGCIFFADENNNILEYVCDGRRIPLAITVNNDKETKNMFYRMFSIFKENGFNVMTL